MASISGAGPSGGVGNVPSAGEMNDYSNKVNQMDTKSLVGELGKNLEPWQRDMAEKALLDKSQDASKGGGAQGAGGAQGGGGDNDMDDDEKKKLLKKLMNGSISDDELKKLAGALGVKQEDLQSLKGKGGGDDGGGGGGAGSQFDIQGG